MKISKKFWRKQNVSKIIKGMSLGKRVKCFLWPETANIVVVAREAGMHSFSQVLLKIVDSYHENHAPLKLMQK